LGEFSPIGPLFYSVNFYITELAQIFGHLPSTENCSALILTKMYRAAFLAIFSQTHLVTSNQFHARRVHMSIKY
jgi:hypothetical protein